MAHFAFLLISPVHATAGSGVSRFPFSASPQSISAAEARISMVMTAPLIGGSLVQAKPNVME
jgi:hypothetical protein